MAISSVSSGYSNVAALQSQNQPARVSEKENDGDSDDGSSSKVAATSAPQGATVNTSGQTIGSIINVQA